MSRKADFDVHEAKIEHMKADRNETENQRLESAKRVRREEDLKRSCHMLMLVGVDEGEHLAWTLKNGSVKMDYAILTPKW